MLFLYILTVLIIIVFAPKVILTYQMKWCKSKLCLNGKTTIVTGANCGIGYETALEFAKRGARVILACRNPAAGSEARQAIVELTKNENVIVRIVDLSSLKSIRKFVENIFETEDRLDILVNNAGAAGLREKITTDGLQLLMQINYFGPFLLTYLLLDLLKKSAPSRIINVSSIGAKVAKLNPDDLNLYSGHFSTYANSKLCNILFTKELAERLNGIGVTAYSVSPGAVRTNIFRRYNEGMRRILYTIISSLYFKTPEEGAQTVLYTALENNLESLSGEHFSDCSNVPPFKTTQVQGLSKKVWDNTKELLKLN